MDIQDILVIVFGLVTILVGVSWAALFKAAKGVVRHGREVKDEWDKAVVDGNITDAELVTIGSKAVLFIEDALAVLQVITNLASSIKRYIRGR